MDQETRRFGDSVNSETITWFVRKIGFTYQLFSPEYISGRPILVLNMNNGVTPVVLKILFGHEPTERRLRQGAKTRITLRENQIIFKIYALKLDRSVWKATEKMNKTEILQFINDVIFVAEQLKNLEEND